MKIRLKSRPRCGSFSNMKKLAKYFIGDDHAITVWAEDMNREGIDYLLKCNKTDWSAVFDAYIIASQVLGEE